MKVKMAKYCLVTVFFDNPQTVPTVTKMITIHFKNPISNMTPTILLHKLITLEKSTKNKNGFLFFIPYINTKQYPQTRQLAEIRHFVSLNIYLT